MRLIAAILFLTKIPLPGKWTVGPKEIGKSTVFFPLVGGGIGGIQWLIVWAVISFSHSLKKPLLVPAPVLSVLLVILGAWITGALHLDGLADMADAFGSWRNREDALRIMRDHRIGSYGATALVLVVTLKVAAIYALLAHDGAGPYLVLAPALARWSVVALSFFMPYARPDEGGLGAALTEHIGRFEIVASTCLALGLMAALAGWRGWVCMLVCILASGWNALWCKRRIQGVTGDTLGANIEICEALILATGSILIAI